MFVKHTCSESRPFSPVPRKAMPDGSVILCECCLLETLQPFLFLQSPLKLLVLVDLCEPIIVGEGMKRQAVVLGRPCGTNQLGCNSIDIIIGPESGPEPGPCYVSSFETCLNVECPSTEFSPEYGPFWWPVFCPKFKVSVELRPRSPAANSLKHI